jgi:hypothetical protein
MDLDLGTYSAEGGLQLSWRAGYVLRATATADREVLVSGNAEGLRSLAQHLLTLADEQVPAGVHAHMEPGLELEEDLVVLVVQKLDGSPT